MKKSPRILDDPQSRQMARNMRDHNWEVMERVAKLGTLWMCWWNKNRHHDRTTAPPDLQIFGLIDGMEFLKWTRTHKDWWVIGEWSDERYAAPVSLTDAGRLALTERYKYDMEPVTGGLVEPGWIATPAARTPSDTLRDAPTDKESPETSKVEPERR